MLIKRVIGRKVIYSTDLPKIVEQIRKTGDKLLDFRRVKSDIHFAVELNIALQEAFGIKHGIEFRHLTTQSLLKGS